MITIFNGRTRSVGGSTESFFMQVDVLMREHLHVFRNGNDANALSVFMAIALHANADGWAWPSTPLLSEETGLITEAAISRCIQHLRTVRIDDHPILHHYRIKEKGRWGRSYYHIFPDAGGAENLPAEHLTRWTTEPPHAIPGVALPVVDVPALFYLSESHSKAEETYAPPENSMLFDDLTSLCAADAAPGDFNTQDTTALTAVKEKANGSENEHATRNGSGANKARPPSCEAPPKPATRKPKAPKVAQPAQYGDVFAALLATAFGVLPQMVKTGVSSPVPKSTKDRCGKVAKALLRDFPDATEADVRTFAADWLATHKNISFPLGEDSYPDHFGRWRLWKAKNATTTDRVPHPLFPVESHITCSVAEARAYTSEAAR